MSERLYFEQLHVGDTWRSQGRTITETDVVNFAGMTGDFDPLHTDHVFASNTPFRKPLAHGLLGLSYLAGLGTNAPAVRTLAFVAIRNWEFLRPIFFGDTVYAVAEITALELKNRRRGLVTWKRQLVNERDEVVQSGTFETLVETQGNKGEASGNT